MNSEVAEAYDKLVPADQTVVDIVIATLVKKDKQIKILGDGISILIEKGDKEDG